MNVYIALQEEPITYENEANYCIAWTPNGATKGLDLGCGARKAAPWLLGVDHHSGVWLEAGDRPHTATPDVVADVRDLPFEDGSQDLVVSTHVVEHFEDTRQLLNEWCRVLRVGGRMALVVPDWRYTFSCKNPEQIESAEGHKADYTLDSFVRMVTQVLPQMELLDARVVNHHWSVGVVLEKV